MPLKGSNHLGKTFRIWKGNVKGWWKKSNRTYVAYFISLVLTFGSSNFLCLPNIIPPNYVGLRLEFGKSDAHNSSCKERKYQLLGFIWASFRLPQKTYGNVWKIYFHPSFFPLKIFGNILHQNVSTQNTTQQQTVSTPNKPKHKTASKLCVFAYWI